VTPHLFSQRAETDQISETQSVSSYRRKSLFGTPVVTYTYTSQFVHVDLKLNQLKEKGTLRCRTFFLL